jgi:hypothetical protein
MSSDDESKTSENLEKIEEIVNEKAKDIIEWTKCLVSEETIKIEGIIDEKIKTLITEMLLENENIRSKVKLELKDVVDKKMLFDSIELTKCLIYKEFSKLEEMMNEKMVNIVKLMECLIDNEHKKIEERMERKMEKYEKKNEEMQKVMIKELLSLINDKTQNLPKSEPDRKEEFHINLDELIEKIKPLVKGDKGDKGDSVNILELIEMLRYLPELKGDKGDKGEKGDKGDDATPMNVSEIAKSIQPLIQPVPLVPLIQNVPIDPQPLLTTTTTTSMPQLNKVSRTLKKN